jgi:hypothetical protein
LNVGARLFLPFTVHKWHNCDPVDATVKLGNLPFLLKATTDSEAIVVEM